MPGCRFSFFYFRKGRLTAFPQSPEQLSPEPERYPQFKIVFLRQEGFIQHRCAKRFATDYFAGPQTREVLKKRPAEAGLQVFKIFRTISSHLWSSAGHPECFDWSPDATAGRPVWLRVKQQDAEYLPELKAALQDVDYSPGLKVVNCSAEPG